MNLDTTLREPARLTDQAARRRVRAGTVSVAAAVALLLFKLAAGLFTHSLSLVASAVDSLTDIFASLVNVFAIRTAARPPVEDHAYGHEKAESLAGLFQGAVISSSGLYLAYESVRRLTDPPPVQQAAVGVGVMCVSAAVSFLLVRYLRRVATETGSPALAADSLHYSTDVIINVSVLVTLAVVRMTGWDVVDPVVSFLISGYIVFSAARVVREAIDGLMDRALPEKFHERVREVVLEDPEIQGVRDVRSRTAGPRRFIEIHLEIDGGVTLRQAHAASIRAHRAVEAAIPNSRVFVHTEPR